MGTFYRQIFKLRIVAVYLFVLGVSGAISYFVYQTGNSISRVNHELTDEQLPLLGYSSQLKHWLNEHERILYEHYATEDEKHNLPKLILAQENINLNLDRLQRAFPHDDKVTQLIALNGNTVATGNQIIAVLKSQSEDRWTQVRELLAAVSKMGRNSQPLINSLNDIIKNEIAVSNQHSITKLRDMSTWVSLFSFAVLLVACFVGYYIYHRIRENTERRRMVLFIEKSPNAIASLNWDGEIQFENVSWRKRFNVDHGDHFINNLREKITEFKTDASKLMLWCFHSNGEDLEVNIHNIASLKQVMVFVENITDRVKAQKSLEFLAYNDPLTGLPNFKKLEIDLDNHLASHKKEPLFLISIMVKRLRSVSTTHGYSVSDALLKSSTVRIKNSIIPVDNLFQSSRLYRYSGAKFLILLDGMKEPTTNDSLFSQIDDCLLTAMRRPLKTIFGSFFLDLQTACVVYPDHGVSSDLLIKNSNAVMNEAQKRNTQSLLLFDTEISAREKYWYELENDLRTVDFESQFYLVYQPKVDIKTGKMNSMEALVRWQHPDKGLISPVEFIPVAEESGLIYKLGLWVLNAACVKAKDWCTKENDEFFQVAVNVSPSQLLNASFLDDVLGCLKQTNLDAKHLEIEITEEVLMEDQETCVDALNGIQQAGISIAIDDFGTGYSSLGYLNKFPIAKLKIDRSFITDIHENVNNKAIVNAIIDLSHNMGVEVVAEGIESEEELRELKSLNCDQGQGFLFDKPLRFDDFNNKYSTKSVT